MLQLLIFILSLSFYVDAQVDICQNFTVAKCRPDAADIIGTPIPLPPSPEAFPSCQDICRIAESDGCNFFRYNGLIGECSLLRSRYTSSCEVVSGPDSPDVYNCIENAGPGFQTCDYFMDEDCIFLGEPRATVDIATTTHDCQELLALIGEVSYQADYFVFDQMDVRCDFLRGSGRSCTGMSGPVKPSMESCGMLEDGDDYLDEMLFN